MKRNNRNNKVWVLVYQETPNRPWELWNEEWHRTRKIAREAREGTDFYKSKIRVIPLHNWAMDSDND